MSAALRLLQLEDAPALMRFELANRAWFESQIDARPAEFYTAGGLQAHIRDLLDQHAQGRWHPFLIVDAGGDILGRANLKDIDTQAGGAEVGYRVARDQLGRGLATLALRHMISAARDEWRLQQLDAIVFDSNKASRAVLQKCGFVETGMEAAHIVRGTLTPRLRYTRTLETP